MKQKGFMNCDQIVTSCRQLEDEIVFEGGRMSSDNGTRR
jgi:hypothetical protein